MKKILCPKCDNPIPFDETGYSEGQSLVFVCEKCKKQFSIRIGKPKPHEKYPYGCLTVVENRFAFAQTLPLREGDNMVGRYSKGCDINTPIDTHDMSVDRHHCILNVKVDKEGKVIYTLRDNPSLTGTFVMNRILGDKERLVIESGTIITIGATTLILKSKEEMAAEEAAK